MPSKTKKMPRFKTPEAESVFWEKNSAMDYQLFPADVDEVLDELKSRGQDKQNITLRLESELMLRLKKKARDAGVKYQTFMREWLWRAVA